ncbi:MAG: hypothetical protein JXB04_10520, partial [Kiritimatiellae bacterium]|nr:hypothetical protein [Kiritimatiellia bacterium]
MKERRDLSRGGRRLRGASYRTAAAVGFALCLSTMLAAPPASAQSGWTLEMFGFDTWTDGWAPSSDPNCQGITNVCQTSDYVYELTGANQLRIDCDLRSEEGKREGRALVDLQTFCPYAIKVPVNLKDLHVGYEFEIPAMDPSVTNTKMQFFLTDVSNHTYYAAAIPFRTNAEHWWGGITVSTNPQSGGSVDAGFDPTRIRYAGIRVAMPTNSTGSYQGPLYTDYDYFYGHPDLFPDPANQKYAFISDAEGFVVQTYVGDRAATNLTWLSSGPSNRTGCLAVDLHLDATNSSYDAGEIYVDLLNDPPFGVAVPVDLKGKRVSAWVFCPAGLGSPPLYRFGVQVFCKDSNWNSFYGSWQTLEPYTTGAWFMVSMTPDTNTPSQGYMAPGFDPTQIRIVGLKVATSTGSGSKYDGKMYVDGFTFEAGPIQPVVSNLQYDFETDEDGFQPTDDPGNLAITSAVQNAETAAHASGSLKLGLNLDGNVPARDAGEVWVDMATYEPFGTPVPTDFAGREVAIYVYCPAGARGPSASPNGLQVFAKDDEWRSEYGTWTPVIEGSWQKVVLVPAATAPANGYMEAGFDPHAIRAIGLKFAANSTSSVYAGPIYMDAVCFAPPAADPFEPPANQRYSFDSTVAGWEAGSGDAGEAITNLFRTTGAPDNSTAALAAEVDLDATDPDKSKGEIVVFMDNDPPYGAVPPVDLEGETVTAWVYCPAGLRGDDETPNGFQLFVKDSSARSFYGEWQTVHEGYWYAVTAVPGTNAAPGGFKDPGFNAREVTAVGLKIGAADGSTAACRGLLFVDGVAFDAPLVPPGITNVQYDFEVDEDGFLPSDDAGNLAITAAVQVADFPAAHGDGTLKAWVNLDGSDGARDGGEVSVDASSFAPFRARYPLDLEGQEVSLYVYCPAGARGDNANPNALRVFVKDTDWRAEYGTWTPIVEGAWQKISLTPSTTEPPNGYMAEGFDPTRIRVVGVSLSAGATSAVYAGPIHVDAVGFETDLVPVQFDFEDGAQAFLPTDYSGDLAITAAVHTTAMSVEGAGALRLDIDLAGSDGARDGGEVAVDMQFFGPIGLDYPIDLENREILLYVYCPAGAGGGSTNLNGLRVLVKDGQWNAEYGPWTPVREGTWQCVSLTPSTNEPLYGYMAPGFDPTQIRMLGLSFSAGDTSSVYTGPLYLDAVCFDAELEMPADLRYGFEPNRQGWQHETYEGLQAVTAVAQSAAAAFEGAYALRMDLDVDSGTNEAKGATSVDMRWYPPPTVRAPFNLDGRKVAAYVYCPPGSGSGDPRNPNKLKLYVKDSDWKSQYGPCTAIREGEWVRVALTPGWTTPAGEGGYMQEGFAPTGIVQVGIEATLHGTYHGPLYLDHVSFPAEAPPAITNSQHTYDFEDECQSRFWKWSTNPQGWNALAWTNTYIAAGQGTANSAALAADAVFAGTNATWDYRKGVFEIAYNPPLNLATKDHRRIQAKVRMDPPVEGLIDFLASINVFDKNTDQWYWKDFNIGDSEWNILEFDLDDADDYSEWSPAGPMDASQIGYLVIQVVANMAWTGTIYVEDVVVGGVELPGSYDPPQGGIVTREGRNFMLDGTNFYFAGVNIEYINQALPLRTVVELLDLTTNLHLDIVRAWGFHEGQDFSFQPARGVWNEMAFENLDRVIAMSGDRNIRLMLGLADNWGHNGGMFKYMEWVLSEHPESLPEELRTTNALGSVALHDEFFVNAYAK